MTRLPFHSLGERSQYQVNQISKQNSVIYTPINKAKRQWMTEIDSYQSQKQWRESRQR